jgi:hypothetical protein
MEPQRAEIRSVSDVAAQNAELMIRGNELLHKAREVARRIEQRCRDAMRTNPDEGKCPSSRSA